MNSNYPPLIMTPAEVSRRAREKRLITLPDEIVSKRQEIANDFIKQIEPISKQLESLTDEQRKAIFVKIEHDTPISLSGTGLKEIAQSSTNFTLAIPRQNNLEPLKKKATEFGHSGLDRNNQPKNPQISAIKAITFASPLDRLSHELYENYTQLITEKWVKCEIEISVLMVRGANQQRDAIREALHKIGRTLANGIRGNLYEHEEAKGTCRVVLWCTGDMFQHFVEDPEWQTLITWFEPRPEFETFHSVFSDFNIMNLGTISSPPSDAPTVCIIDSGVSAGNPFLEPVVREDMLLSFLESHPDNPSDASGHGSGVASLASYYALNIYQGAENEAKVWIASARVLDEDNQLEEKRLLSRLLRDIVEHFQPLGVRIFNLSLNIVNRRWNRDTKRTQPRTSWVARSIDIISKEYDVIFVICTGNISQRDVKAHHERGLMYPNYYKDDESCLCDPAQSSLALTVGSIVPTTLAVDPRGRITAIAERFQPSPFTRCGPGINKTIKPDLVEYGGNYHVDNEDGSVVINPGSAILFASNKLTPALSFDVGTSFATPRVTYHLAQVYSDLQKLGLERISAPLLKAFLVNSSALRGIEELKRLTDEEDDSGNNYLSNVIGYGNPNYIDATTCDEHTAILYFDGEIGMNSVVFFDIPIPSILSQTKRRDKKVLTITLCYYPEVQRWGLDQYMGTTLKWRIFRGDVERDAIIRAMSEEIGPDELRPNEIKLKYGVDKRSRGTVQHDYFEWFDHKDEYSQNHYTLAIASSEKWKRQASPPVPFAVVVRIQDTSQTVAVYSEVDRLLNQIKVEARA
jgi:hypothetical protein